MSYFKELLEDFMCDSLLEVHLAAIIHRIDIVGKFVYLEGEMGGKGSAL